MPSTIGSDRNSSESWFNADQVSTPSMIGMGI